MEKWKNIRGRKGYQVSSEGRVRSVDRVITDKWRTKKLKGRILKLREASRYGHLVVNLSRLGAKKTEYVHQLVATAFLGLKPRGHVVRHGENGRHDNSVANLSYGSKSADMLDKRRDGTHGGKAVLRSDGEEFINQSVAAEESKCHQSDISKCCLGSQKTAGGFGWKFQIKQP